VNSVADGSVPGAATTWPRLTWERRTPRSSSAALSPASAPVIDLPNVSMPVTTVCNPDPSPSTSTVSPTRTTPRSTAPVTTVPRPAIVNTLSIGMRNGASRNRSGTGTCSSTAASSERIDSTHSGVAGERPQPGHPDHRRGRVTVAGQQLADLQLDQVEQLGVPDRVGLVERDHDVLDPHLPGDQHVLVGLRHHAVDGGDHQDRPVELGRTRDHVLHVVGVARHVDVGVVPGRGLVLDVRQVDRDTPDDLLEVLVDPVERRVLRPAPLGEHLGDRGGERGLAVVDVTHRADVQVRLGPHERLLHVPFLWLPKNGRHGEPVRVAHHSPPGSPGATGEWSASCAVE
jgi:hypothetical protein